MSQPVAPPGSRCFALLALGTNATSHGFSRHFALRRVIDALSETGCIIRSTSRIYETPAFPDPTVPSYLNAVVRIETTLPAAETLELCHRIEADLGRIRDRRWGSRLIDVDLLAYGDEDMSDVLPDIAGFKAWCDLAVPDQMKQAPDQLIVPHPRLQDRSFVLVPMKDVAPDWRHPVLGLSVNEMLLQRPKSERDEIQLAGIEF